MIVTILGSGTSQGVPVIGCTCPVCQSKDPRDKRLRTSILIQTDEVTVAVDAGPDFRQQMLRENVTKLDAVLITHEHKDHIGGLDDLRPYIFKQQKCDILPYPGRTAAGGKDVTGTYYKCIVPDYICDHDDNACDDH